MERFSRDHKPVVKAQPGEPQSPPVASASAATGRPAVGSSIPTSPSWAAKLFIGMLIVVALVVTSALAVGAFVKNSSDDLVKNDQYQAVFLDNGQVYFGRLSNTNQKYVQLTDIYYLQVNQPVQPDQVEPGAEDTAQQQQAQISLAKLGNELHGPEDQMFIHRDKIVFWENLKADGQVTTAITDFVNTNTDGQ